MSANTHAAFMYHPMADPIEPRRIAGGSREFVLGVLVKRLGRHPLGMDNGGFIRRLTDEERGVTDGTTRTSTKATRPAS